MIKDRVTAYWGKRSDSFFQQKLREWESPLKERWLALLGDYLPDRPLKVLDIGCGVGLFSAILAQKGHEVVGIDLTQEMVNYARDFVQVTGVSGASFQVMDAEALDFADASFDLVIARNVTWTLPDAPKAYKEWLRVLKPGGILINIDGDYGASSMSDMSDIPDTHAHHELSQNQLDECEAIQREMRISTHKRPQWDANFLLNLAVDQVTVDRQVSAKVYLEKDEFYNPTPLFLIQVVKSHEEA